MSLEMEEESVKSDQEEEENEENFEARPQSQNDTLENRPENETIENKPKPEALEIKPENDTLENKLKPDAPEIKPENEAEKSMLILSGSKTIATQTEISVSNFVQVSAPFVDGASKETFELPLDKSGELSLVTLRTEFPNASGIKYKNPETGMMRILKQERGCIAPPPEGWGKTQFVVCIFKDLNLKRSAPSDNDRLQGKSKMAKTSRGLLQAPALNASMGVMGPMGGPPISMPGGPMMNQGPVMGPPQGPGPARSLMNPILGLSAMSSMNGPQGGGPGPGMGNVYSNMNMFPPGPQLQGHQQFNNGFEMSYTDITMDDLGMQNFDNNFGPGPFGGPPGPGIDHPTNCDLCHVQLNSITQAQLHFEGKRHNDAVNQMQAQMNAGPSGYQMMPMHAGGPSQSMRSGGGRTGLLGRGGDRPFQSNKGGGNYRNNNNNNRNFDNRNRRNGPAGNFRGGGRGSGNRRGGFKNGRGGGGGGNRNRSRDQNGPDDQPQSFANDDWSSSGFNDFSGPSA